MPQSAPDLTRFPKALRARYVPLRVVGEGGAGVVYEARALEAPEVDRTVAVKVIAERHLRSANARHAFVREAQATLRLKHPHVVELIDFEATPGQPAWLVTEFLGGGHLGLWRRQWPGWRALLDALDGALAGLAWAHARGIVHCDIKPENILLEAPEAGGRARLADFGVARLSAHSLGHAATDSREWHTEELSGTPSYMAPEQAEGRLGAYGPWTDIYALGIVLYEVVTGQVPFDAESVSGILLKHLNEPLPPPVLRPGVPNLVDIEHVLGWMLAKDPWDRPRFAAHVRRELAGLRDDAAVLDALAPSLVPIPESAPMERRTLPSAGRLHGAQRDGEAAASAGLRQLRIVEQALVGRSGELETLQTAADLVLADERPHVVLLEGPPGIGKSRLIQALRERLEEHGVMQSWSGSFRVGACGATTGLRGMIEAFYLCLGLDRRQTSVVLEQRLARLGASDPWEHRALLGWLRPDLEAPGVPDASAVGLALRAAERAAAQHPLLIWLDDVQHGFDGQVLPFTERLLHTEASPLPILLVLSGRALDADYDPDGLLGRRVEALERNPRFVRQRLRALSQHAITRLLVEEIGLPAEQARRIAERTAGQPHLALQAARAAVQLEGVRDAPEHLAVRGRGEAVTVLGESDALGEPMRPIVISPLASGRLLEGHVDELLAGLPSPTGERVLGMLALLGPTVALHILETAVAVAWPSSAHRPDIAAVLDGAAVAGLIDRGNVDGQGEVVRLPHEPLIGLMAARLERSGAASAAHHAAAEALRQAFGHGHALAARARHLSRADRPSDAWVLMRAAIEDAVEHGRYSEAVALCSEVDAWLDVWGEPRQSEWRGVLLRAMAQAAIRCGALHEARRHLDAELARPSQDAAVLAERALLRAELLAGQSDVDAAIPAFDVARRGFEVLGLAGHQARALLGLARALRIQGDLEHARARAIEARPLYERVGDLRGRAATLRALGQIDVYLDDLEGARRSYEGALELSARLGDLHGTADVQRGLGGLALEQGRADDARQMFSEALTAYETIGDVEGTGHALRGLARARMLRGQTASARDCLERAIARFEDLGSRLGSAACLLDLASLLRAEGAAEQAVEALERAMASYRRAGDERGEASCLMTLGNIHLDAERHGEALERHQQALRLFWRIGHQRGVLLARLNLGHTHLRAGSLDAAHGLLSQAASEALDAGAHDLRRLAAGYHAVVHARRGDLAGAETSLLSAIADPGADEAESAGDLGGELATALEQLADAVTTAATPMTAERRRVAVSALDAAARLLERHGQHAERRRLLERRDAMARGSTAPAS